MLFKIYRNIRRNITEDGLIVSSSGFLVRRMVGKIEFSRPLRVLEIGSGRGAFTREIIQRMCHQSQLDVCEIKADYNPWIEQLMAGNPDKQVRLHNCCVTELLTEAGEYDVILSSLPLKNFESINDNNAFLYKIIATLKSGLRDGGIYLQYQYFRSNKADIESIFGKPMDNIDFVALNVLPAFVYSMTKDTVEHRA